MGDRLTALRDRETEFTGLDFVHVVSTGPLSQRELHVFFHTDPRLLDPPFDPTVAATAVPVASADVEVEAQSRDLPPVDLAEGVAPAWDVDPLSGRPFLRVVVEQPGGFGRYRLRLRDPRVDAGGTSRIDPFFATVDLDFKIACDDGLDCDPIDVDACPPDDPDPAVLDYLARDFTTYVDALTTFVRQRHPDWSMPSLADPSAALLDALAALGDELAFSQDAVVGESTLAGATQWRSRRAHARLVDFERHDGRCASTELDVRVAVGTAATVAVPAGARVTALRQDGADDLGPVSPTEPGDPLEPSVATFEVGRGIDDQHPDPTGPPQVWSVHATWNTGTLSAWWFDDDDAALLPCGTTSLLVVVPATMPALDTWPDEGRRLLVEQPGPPGAAPLRQAVTVTAVEGEDDTAPLTDPLTGTRYLRLRWTEGLRFEVDLRSAVLGANLVPIVAGTTRYTVVRVGPPDSAGVDDPTWVLQTVERAGPLESDAADPPPAMRPVVHRVTLPGSAVVPLGWTGTDLRTTQPEIRVRLVMPGTVLTGGAATALTAVEARAWDYRPLLVESGPDDRHVALEDGSWTPVSTLTGPDGPSTLVDYASDAGTTLRFGSGGYGATPSIGDRFWLAYRLSRGSGDNVAADTVRRVPPGSTLPPEVEAISNPFTVMSGVPAESAADVVDLAPVAWRRRPLFAVRTDDYADRAEDLDWVDRAAADLRWTGSWNSVLVAADPAASLSWTTEQALGLHDRMWAVKQAGRDVVTLSPRYVALDLRITLCVAEGHHPAQVAAAVHRALVGPLPAGEQPFFSPGVFTFGTPLDRSRLDAAVLAVPGVHALLHLELGARGMRALSAWTGREFSPGVDGLLRLDADRRTPQHGTLEVVWEEPA